MNKLIFILGVAMAIAFASCSGNKNTTGGDTSGSNSSNSAADDPGMEPEVIKRTDSTVFNNTDTSDFMIKQSEEQYEEKPSDYELQIKN